MFKLDKDAFREATQNTQYQIPRRYDPCAYRFPHVTYMQAVDLYEIAVSEVLTTYNIENLIDLPFGKGFACVKELWENKLAFVENLHIKNQKEPSKSAREMFEALGYTMKTKPDKIIYYKDDDNVYCFDLKHKTFYKSGQYYPECDEIIAEELKAINKHFKELGWIE